MPPESARHAAIDRPRSASNFALSLLAMSAGLGLVWAIAPGHHIDTTRIIPYAPLIPCLGIVAVIALAEWKWPALRVPSAGAIGAPCRERDLRRVAVRLWGFVATLILVALAYSLFPEYHGNFYDPYWLFLRTLAPAAVLIPVYFWWTDRRTIDSHDEYLAFGSLVSGSRHGANGALIQRHLLGWAVKAFFLPLMTVYLSSELRALYSAFDAVTPQTMALYQVFYHLSYTVDLIYCVVGYSAAIRLFDAQIRSVEPTEAGWLVALVCYQPFYSVIGRFYLQYDDETFWDNWLQAWPNIRMFWAALIIALTSIYALCTVAFGLRFSNLTHRGIITSGPYRFTKHPAYLAKNLSWWLISAPFISELGWTAALRNCMLLSLLNGLYYLRARTEERHLSRDPNYVAYALWMNEHGLFCNVARALPFLRYRAPQHPIARAADATRLKTSHPPGRTRTRR